MTTPPGKLEKGAERSPHGAGKSSGAPVAVVTGATSGIGQRAAIELARRGFHVIAHGRDAAKVAEVERAVQAASASRRGEGRVAELGSLEAVAGFVSGVRARHAAVDVLVLGAATVPAAAVPSADGHELAFAVNVLAPYALAVGLRPALEAARAARVVFVSSNAHRGARLDVERLASLEGYDVWETYAATKAAELLLVAELAERWAATRVGVFGLHPGVVRTRLQQALSAARGGDGGATGDVASAAGACVYVATAPTLPAPSGAYFVKRPGAKGPPAAEAPAAVARDPAKRRALWALCERLVG